MTEAEVGLALLELLPLPGRGGEEEERAEGVHGRPRPAWTPLAGIPFWSWMRPVWPLVHGELQPPDSGMLAGAPALAW